MTMRILLILISFFCLANASANYQEQSLLPLNSSEIDELDIRKLPPNKKKYPILDEFEKHLYPGRNFHKDSPNQRLERVEIAVFGAKQEGGIKSRLSSLEMELNSWDIAKVSSPKSPRSPQKISQEITPAQYIQTQPIVINKNPYNPRKKQIDYDYMNYRMISPLIQNVGRRSISAMFNTKRR